MRATVVGAGVSGLTTALALADVGWRVSIVARDTHETMVSMVAAAVWTMTDAEPTGDARRWALTSRERFAALAADPTTGVVPLHQREIERDDPPRSWWETTPHVRRLRGDELPPGYGGGFAIDGFSIEPPTYLAWLRTRLDAHGIHVEQRSVSHLAELGGDVVVNCTGLGAADLTGDTSLRPIRGQVVVIANPGIRDAIADESDRHRIAYVYPRSQEVILGGTRQLDDRRLDPDDGETRRILADCAVLDPRVAGRSPIEVRVGLRPGRPAVRVDAEPLADGRSLLHNYGHGGAGYILSWGCALDVVGLAAR